MGSVASTEMLFRSNLLAVVGGGMSSKFDEKAGEFSFFALIPCSLYCIKKVKGTPMTLQSLGSEVLNPPLIPELIFL